MHYVSNSECIWKKLDETKYMSFLISDDELLEKYNKLWDKVRKSIRKEFDNEPVYNKKHLKAKIKSYVGKINASFCSDKLPKKGSHCICLSITLIDSVLK